METTPNKAKSPTITMIHKLIIQARNVQLDQTKTCKIFFPKKGLDISISEQQVKNKNHFPIFPSMCPASVWFHLVNMDNSLVLS